MRLCKYGNRPLLPKVSIKHVLSLVETVYFIIVRIREEKAQQCVSFQLQNFFWFIPKFIFWIACIRIKSKNKNKKKSDPIMEITILIPYHFITFSTFCKTLIRLVSHRGFSSVNQKVNIRGQYLLCFFCFIKNSHCDLILSEWSNLNNLLERVN